MNSPPLVSIGLFVYNGERFLEQALNSILKQTFSDFELIISDNASTDRTEQIARSYARLDKRIRYYRAEKNMGAGWNARRVCELATGKYFKWICVDDWIEPEFLRRCVAVLENDPGCVLAHTQTKWVDEGGKFIRNYSTPMAVVADDPIVRFREMLLIDSWGYQIYGVMRMSALRRIPPQGSYVNGDGVLLARMALLGRFYEVSEYLSVSRHHGGQSVEALPIRVTRPRRFRLTDRYPALPSPEWWDPAKARRVTFPEFRQLVEYFLSINRAPLSAGQKLRCYPLLLLWIKTHFLHLLKDLLIAADQVLYNLQVPKEPIEHNLPAMSHENELSVSELNIPQTAEARRGVE